MKKALIITLLFTACQKSINLPEDRKEAKPAKQDTITVTPAAPLSDSVYLDELPQQTGTPITVNGRLFIKH